MVFSPWFVSLGYTMNFYFCHTIFISASLLFYYVINNGRCAYLLSEGTASSYLYDTTHYVTELYIPLTELTNEISLAIFVDCSMNNVQFGENQTYPATLTLDTTLTKKE